MADGTEAAVDAGAVDQGVIDAGKGAAAPGEVAGKTIADGAAGADDGKEVAAGASDWRDALAGDDADFRKKLDRFSDEKAVAQWYKNLERKVRAGEIKPGLKENATPEEVAAYRKEQGLPESGDGYLDKLDLPNGMVIGEHDKPIVSELAGVALDLNMKPGEFSRLVGKYYEIQDAQQAAQEDRDDAFKDESREALKEMWPGADFKRNLAAVNNLVAGWGPELAGRVLTARTKDGRILGDDPAYVQQLANIARELNPVGSLVPSGGGDPGKAGEARLAEIESWMGAPKGSPEYKKYWSDDGVQAEWRELSEALSKMKGRAA